jgi:hypothetical protein
LEEPHREDGLDDEAAAEGVEAEETLLADRPLFAKVGDTVFVHGGILPKHVRYGLDRMNDEVDAWLLGRRAALPAPLVVENGPLWTRAYSTPSEDPDCNALDEGALGRGAEAHGRGPPVQPSAISNACQGRVWRIDVGMSRALAVLSRFCRSRARKSPLREGDAAR